MKLKALLILILLFFTLTTVIFGGRWLLLKQEKEHEIRMLEIEKTMRIVESLDRSIQTVDSMLINQNK